MPDTTPAPHLCISTGGTGGHFFPALSIAREFRKTGRVTLFIAGHHTAEQVAVAEKTGFDAVPGEALRLPGCPGTLLLFPFRFTRAFLDARRNLAALKPDAVLGMGSFASVPVGLAAASLRIPLVLHEGNAVTGRANRFLSRWARRLAASFPEQAGKKNVRCPVTVTGFPVRPELVEAAKSVAVWQCDGGTVETPDTSPASSPATATASLSPTATPPHRHTATPAASAAYLAAHKLAPGSPTLLVFGGSQGARFINELVAETLSQLPEETRYRFQLIHLTGQEDNAALRERYERLGVQATVKRSETDMASAYRAASLVLCRAGSSTISELALFGVPAALIPLPSAADDHQTANARIAARNDAAILLPQPQATPETLLKILNAWLADPQAAAARGARLRDAMARPAAAGEVVAMALGELRKPR